MNFLLVNLLFWVLVLDEARGQNTLGGDQSHQCTGTGVLTSVQSSFMNKWLSSNCPWPNRDRVWTWSCSSTLVENTDGLTGCHWLMNGQYLNQYYGTLNETCGKDEVLTGISSTFDCQRDDRRFKLRCCSISESGYKTVSCTYTSNFINSLEQNMNYAVGSGRAIVGLYSVYSSTIQHMYYNEPTSDRRWKVYHCEIEKVATTASTSTIAATTATSHTSTTTSIESSTTTSYSHTSTTTSIESLTTTSHTSTTTSIESSKTTTSHTSATTSIGDYVSVESSTTTTTAGDGVASDASSGYIPEFMITATSLTQTSTPIGNLSPVKSSETATIKLVSTNPAGSEARSSGSATVVSVSMLIVLLFVITLATIVAVTLVIFVRRRRKKAGDDNNLLHDYAGVQFQAVLSEKSINFTDINLINPTYQATVSDGVLAQTKNIYDAVNLRPNELKAGTNNSSAVASESPYQYIASDTSEFSDMDEHQIYYTPGLCVPNKSQRQQLDESEENVYGKLKDMYSWPPQEYEQPFFAENATYWNPENSTEGIYEQLAQRRYREIPRHDIKVISQLGTGQFGSVDKGVWHIPNGSIDVAVKTLKGSATKDEELKFLQEAAINGQFRHVNVVQLYGVVTVGQPIMIVMECITNGDLKSFLENIRAVPGELPDDSLPAMLFKFSHQVACGMAYLSSKKFVHRDLAARNILVSNENVCKIADFGMSRNLQDEIYYASNSKKIPVKWTAPEALYYRKYTMQSDVWSFGIVLYEIWSVGHKPFEQYKNQECIKLIDSGFRLPSPPGCPKLIYEIMINCWHPVAAHRPSFDDLKSVLSHSQSLLSPNDHPTSNLGVSVLSNRQLYSELQNRYKL